MGTPMEVGRSPLCAPQFENNKGTYDGLYEYSKYIITTGRNYSLVGKEDTAGRRANSDTPKGYRFRGG